MARARPIGEPVGTAAPARPIDDVLPCVVDRVVEQLRATGSPRDVLARALEVGGIPSDRVAFGRFVAVLIDRASAAIDSQHVALPKPVLQAHAAIALVEGGTPDGARRLATQALAGRGELSDNDRDEVLRVTALAITASGGDVPAEVRQSHDRFAELQAVQGLARSGRGDEAHKLLADVPPPTELALQGAYLMALARLGDIAAARAMLDRSAPRDPVLRTWFASALVDSKDAKARAAIDRDLSELEASANHATSSDEMVKLAVLWSELVRLREKQDAASAHNARRRFDDWLLAKDDVRRELLSDSVVSATYAGNVAEATRLKNALATPLGAIQRIGLALMADDLMAALEALAQQQTERSLAEQMLVAKRDMLLDGFDLGEIAVWLVLAARPSVDPAIVSRFRALACAVSSDH
jgi:hypothetical protein